MGDYIDLNQDQEKLTELSRLASTNKKKQMGFTIATVLGVLTTLIIIWAYFRSRRQEKNYKGTERKNHQTE